MALDICSTNQCPTLIRKGLITKSLWQYPWRNPNKCQKPLDKIPEKMVDQRNFILGWLIKRGIVPLPILDTLEGLANISIPMDPAVPSERKCDWGIIYYNLEG